ncbi:hypothetical protein GCM10023231_02340 [Olivibacter ginsenosidimutans]|uniref:Lipoprotein n=1 Tax=Olivibacter ginsenosidimutans TaxID=1176537 RepID=A0ABP9AE93_9SPHI
MKNLIRISCVILCLVGLYACDRSSQTKKHANWADSTFQNDSTVVDSSEISPGLCFLHLTGKSPRRDSTYVHFSILGNKVTGQYRWVPFEKDSRIGTISGTKSGDTIRVVWSFTQEGTLDTLATAFLLQQGQLKQRPFIVNQKNGRQQTDERSGFTLRYQKISCN